MFRLTCRVRSIWSLHRRVSRISFWRMSIDQNIGGTHPYYAFSIHSEQIYRDPARISLRDDLGPVRRPTKVIAP